MKLKNIDLEPSRKQKKRECVSTDALPDVIVQDSGEIIDNNDIKESLKNYCNVIGDTIDFLFKDCNKQKKKKNKVKDSKKKRTVAKSCKKLLKLFD